MAAGRLGENVTTSGVDLLGLPTGTRLRLGETAVIEITGLRNPCIQLDFFQEGLLPAVLDRDENGAVVRKSGVMAIVLAEGVVRPATRSAWSFPPTPPPPPTRLGLSA